MHTFTNNNMNTVDSCKVNLVFPLQKRGEKLIVEHFVYYKRPFFSVWLFNIWNWLFIELKPYILESLFIFNGNKCRKQEWKICLQKVDIVLNIFQVKVS